MIAVIGLIIGIVLGVLLDPTVPAWLAPFLPVECGRGLPPCVSGDAARCRLGNDDGSCCRPWHSYFLQHGIDSPPTAEGLT